MARPEGYRKAVRLMELADRFGLPVVTFVDTAGAYPGIGAEERGQAEAIARSTDVPWAQDPDRFDHHRRGRLGRRCRHRHGESVLMLEHSIYSVISPEGAASILWHDSARARKRPPPCVLPRPSEGTRGHRRNRAGAGRRRTPGAREAAMQSVRVRFQLP